jgi:hypothetical protein
VKREEPEKETVTAMHDLHQLDQSWEEPVYTNTTIAELHQQGKLSRSEAEAFDILATSFTGEDQEDKPISASMVEERLERSYIAIIHEGSILPIFNLERMQRPTTLTEKLLLSTRIASAVFDALLVFLEEEGGEDNEHSGPI